MSKDKKYYKLKTNYDTRHIEHPGRRGDYIYVETDKISNVLHMLSSITLNRLSINGFPKTTYKTIPKLRRINE